MKRVMVLGAYGLVGSAVIDELLALSGVEIVAVGRRSRKMLASVPADPLVERLVMDIAEHHQLKAALKRVDLVINCVGPYLKHGEAVASLCVGHQTHYIDVASEQEHLRRLMALDGSAVENDLCVVTAAGLYPGISGVLSRNLMEGLDGPCKVRMALAMGHPAQDGQGEAVLASGLMELSFSLEHVEAGQRVPFTFDEPGWACVFPEPFGTATIRPWPQIELLTLEEDSRVEEARSGWWMAGITPTPGFILRGLKRLDPANHPWVFNALLGAARRRMARSFDKTPATGLAAALEVSAENRTTRRSASLLVPDGVRATASMTIVLASRILKRQIESGVSVGMNAVDWSGLEECARSQSWAHSTPAGG